MTYSKPEIRSMHEEYEKTKDQSIKSKLIVHYFPFVTKIAVKLSEKLNWQAQPDELASFGVDGLSRAIDGYSTTAGVKFESYATKRVGGSMIDGLRRQDSVPRSVRIAADQFGEHKRRIQNKQKHRISDVEFVNIIGMNETEFHRSYQKYNPITFSSIDSHVDSESQEDMKPDSNGSLVDKHTGSPDSSICRKEFFSKMLGKDFTAVERKIIFFYYYKGMTMNRVAQLIDLSESRVSKMHKKILERLRDKIKRNPEYFDDDIFSFLGKRKTADSIY